MRGFRSPLQVVLSDSERQELIHLVRASLTPNALARRARMVLLRAEGLPIMHIAKQLVADRSAVRKWIRRYTQDGLNGLKDKPRSGRPPTFSPSCRYASGKNCL